MSILDPHFLYLVKYHHVMISQCKLSSSSIIHSLKKVVRKAEVMRHQCDTAQNVNSNSNLLMSSD